ncbi:putative lipoprotein precursor (fragment) [Tenacibaculum maritimum]
MTIIYSDLYLVNTAYIDDDGNKIADPKEEQYINSSVYIIRNDAMDMTTPGRTSAQRLIATFK